MERTAARGKRAADGDLAVRWREDETFDFQALRSGAGEFLTQPFVVESLVRAWQRLGIDWI